MHDKYITIIDICLIFNLMLSLICHAIKRFAFSDKKVRFLQSFADSQGSPFSIDFLGLGGSQVNLNLKMEFKKVEVEL
jgi:hypothetical protein